MTRTQKFTRNWGKLPGRPDPNFIPPNPDEHLPSMEDIRAAESSDEAYRLGVKRRGWLAARRGKERKSPYVPGALTTAWLSGYDLFSGLKPE